MMKTVVVAIYREFALVEADMNKPQYDPSLLS